MFDPAVSVCDVRQPAAPASYLGALPAIFSGDLPCADCRGVRHIVGLHADHVFVYRRTYSGRGEARSVTHHDDIGRWTLSADGGKAWPGQSCEPEGGDATVTSLAATGWHLVDASIGAPTPDDVSRITLKFTRERVSASSGCNTGIGAYGLDGGTLVATQLATTQKACLGSLAQWEPAFFRFLTSKPAVTGDAGMLVLRSGDHWMRWRAMPMPSAAAVQKFIYVAAERTPCTGVGPRDCLQIREKQTDAWQPYHGEIIGFTHEPGIEYRLRILEDDVPHPPADGPSTRWFLDLVVEQRVVKR